MDIEVTGKYLTKLNESMIYDSQTQEPFNEELFRQVYQYEPIAKPSLTEKLKKGTKCTPQTFLNIFPILKWLPRYKRENIASDLIAGLTVAIMHIPQGMAYALLGGVPPVVGIYMAFFPVLIYIFMGTSRHVSMGTFAVICMMTGKSVAMYSHPFETASKNSTEAIEITERIYSPIEVATVVCFIVGIWQVVLSILKLGSLSVLLSDTLVSGFTTGAAVHVFTSQVKNLFGLSVKRYSGPLKLIYTYYDIFCDINKSNLTAVILSGCFLVSLLMFNEVVKPLLQKKFKRVLPIPIELIMVIVGTLLSVQLDLKKEYNISVVDDVPTGLPIPKVPPLELLPNLVVDGLVIAIVALSINLSMASIFAKKLNYEIEGNQEILASGVGNIFGAFFSCMPFSASLSRSLIQESVGGKTQIASVVSCILLVFVLLFIGPFFEPLPYCVLSTIIVVALKGMFMQFKDLPKTYRLSKLDGTVWLVTFLSVVVLDIDYGLGVGLIASVATMIIRSQTPEILTIGHVPNTNVYLDLKRFKKAEQLKNILILQIVGGLHFANCESTRKKIINSFLDFQNSQSIVLVTSDKPSKSLNVVLNLSTVPFVDPSAIKSLFSIYCDLKKINVNLIICECTTSVYESLKFCDIFEDYPKSMMFPTLHDALDFVKRYGSSERLIDVKSSSIQS